MVGDETDRAKEMTQTDASTDSVTDRPFRYRMREDSLFYIKKTRSV